MKTCKTCNTEKPLSDFHKKGKTPSGNPRWRNDCKSCKAKVDRAGYNPVKTALQSKALINRNRKIVTQYLNNHPCVDCGEPDIVVLEFDHVRGTKIKNISSMVVHHSPVKVLMDEIAKCEVRCANCHRRVTAARGNWLK